MGQFLAVFNRDPIEPSGVVGPAFRTPFSDITGPAGPSHMRRCGDYELRWLDCCEAHGHIKAKTICANLQADFVECCHAHKQLKRVELMMDERDRQHYKRLWSGESGNRYAEDPPMDAYAPEHTSDL